CVTLCSWKRPESQLSAIGQHAILLAAHCYDNSVPSGPHGGAGPFRVPANAPENSGSRPTPEERQGSRRRCRFDAPAPPVQGWDSDDTGSGDSRPDRGDSPCPGGRRGDLDGDQGSASMVYTTL